MIILQLVIVTGDWEQIRYISVIINDIITDKLDVLNKVHNFIITAPTNKAKDILVNKYNIYIEGLNSSDIINTADTSTISTTSIHNQDQNNNLSLLKKIIIILSKK